MNKSLTSVVLFALCLSLIPNAHAAESKPADIKYKIAYSFDEAYVKAQAGDPQGCFETGLYYTGINNVPRDPDKARRYINTACDKGYAWAHLFIGLQYTNHTYLHYKDPSDYLRVFEGSWDADYPYAPYLNGQNSYGRYNANTNLLNSAVKHLRASESGIDNPFIVGIVTNSLQKAKSYMDKVQKGALADLLNIEYIAAVERGDTNGVAVIKADLEKLSGIGTNDVMACMGDVFIRCERDYLFREEMKKAQSSRGRGGLGTRQPNQNPKPLFKRRPFYTLTNTFEEACAKAKSGDAQGSFEAGVYFSGVKGIPRDTYKAGKYFDKAYEKDYPYAVLLRGYALIRDDRANIRSIDSELKIGVENLVEGLFEDGNVSVCWSPSIRYVSSQALNSFGRTLVSLGSDFHQKTNRYEYAIADFNRFIGMNPEAELSAFVGRQIDHLKKRRRAMEIARAREQLKNELLRVREEGDESATSAVTGYLKTLDAGTDDVSAIIAKADEYEVARDAEKQQLEAERDVKRAEAEEALKCFAGWPGAKSFESWCTLMPYDELEAEQGVHIVWDNDADGYVWTNRCGCAVLVVFRDRDFAMKFDATGTLRFVGKKEQAPEYIWLNKRTEELKEQGVGPYEEAKRKWASEHGMTIEEAEEAYHDLKAKASENRRFGRPARPGARPMYRLPR